MIKPLTFPQTNGGKNSRVCAATAGKLFKVNARRQHQRWIKPLVQYAFYRIVSRAVIDIKKSLRCLQRVGIGSKPFGSKLGRKDTATRTLPDVKRLRHGAEIGFDAAGIGCCDRNCLCSLCGI